MALQFSSSLNLRPTQITLTNRALTKVPNSLPFIPHERKMYQNSHFYMTILKPLYPYELNGLIFVLCL